MKLVNRSVLVLKPTVKMLDWINSVGEESDPATPEEAQEMTNAYLGDYRGHVEGLSDRGRDIPANICRGVCLVRPW